MIYRMHVYNTLHVHCTISVFVYNVLNRIKNKRTYSNLKLSLSSFERVQNLDAFINSLGCTTKS